MEFYFDETMLIHLITVKINDIVYARHNMHEVVMKNKIFEIMY